jgi:hypothetical protein
MAEPKFSRSSRYEISFNTDRSSVNCPGFVDGPAGAGESVDRKGNAWLPRDVRKYGKLDPEHGCRSRFCGRQPATYSKSRRDQRIKNKVTTAEAYDPGWKTERNLSDKDFVFGRLDWRKDNFGAFDWSRLIKFKHNTDAPALTEKTDTYTSLSLEYAF